MAHCSILAAFLTFLAGPAATRTYPPQFENADVHVYKQVGDVPLNLYVFNPPAADASQPGSKPAARPAIVFFFGGGWANGSPQQFEPHCRYFASRGMVAVAADYRVASRHGAKIVDCVEDAKSALRWVRSHAHELGVDPDRIVAAGGSAGGHIAACTGVLAAFDAKTEDQTISSKPTAMVLFNPVLSFVAKDPAAPDRRIASFAKRAGVEPSEVCPHSTSSPGRRLR